MSLEISKDSVIQTTKEGRLYIENKDFFKQEKVQHLVKKLMDSTVFKDIENRKKEEAKKISNAA